MSRLHSSRRGKSGSKKPTKQVVPSWVSYKAPEVEQLVIKFGKQGFSPAKAGSILRDQYGIPSVKTITGKRVLQIFEDNGIKTKLPYDMTSLLERAGKVMKHIEANKKDNASKRGLKLMESKILRLAKYYKRIGKLPQDWRYSAEHVKLLVE